MRIPFALQDVEAFLQDATDLGSTANTAVSVAHITDEIADCGLSPGEVVLIAIPNSVDLLRYFFGVIFAGGVPTIIPPGTPSARATQIAERLGARTLILPPQQTSPYQPVARRRIGQGDLLLLAPAPGERHEPGQVIIPTSGTSGMFSGCLHDMSSLVRNAARHAAAVGLRAGDVVLVNLPMNFSYALVAGVGDPSGDQFIAHPVHGSWAAGRQLETLIGATHADRRW
jgi:long-chain acyl-CoA synthetase